MPPPTVWGPTTWQFFHIFAESIKEDAFASLGKQVFQHIAQICTALPCPECTQDATKTLARVKESDIDTRKKLIDTIYLFHNYVNAKTNKPMFDYNRLGMYRNIGAWAAFQRFVVNYQTRGNHQLMNDSMRRGRILQGLRSFLSSNLAAFTTLAVPASISTDQDASNSSIISSNSTIQTKPTEKDTDSNVVLIIREKSNA